MPLKKLLLSFLNCLLGLFIGLISAFCMAAIIDAEVSNIVSAAIPSFISGVIIILIPTSFATAGVWWNISTQKELAEKVRDRELKAAIMSMPNALYEFDLVCNEHIKYLSNDEYIIPKEFVKLDTKIE